MIILDTDHFSALKYVGTPACELLRARMSVSRDQDFAVNLETGLGAYGTRGIR